MLPERILLDVKLLLSTYIYIIVSGGVVVIGMGCATNVDLTNALANTECVSLACACVNGYTGSSCTGNHAAVFNLITVFPLVSVCISSQTGFLFKLYFSCLCAYLACTHRSSGCLPGRQMPAG